MKRNRRLENGFLNYSRPVRFSAGFNSHITLGSISDVLIKKGGK